jgi:WD40 repeat protein
MIQLQANDRPVAHLTFSPDGALLSASSERGEVRLWDLAGQKSVRVYAESHWVGNPTAFTPDARSLLFVRHGLRVWDVAAGRLTHDETIRGRMLPSLVLSRDGGRLFVTHWDPKARTCCWELPARQVLWTIAWTMCSSPDTAALSGDGTLFATGHYDKQVRLWDAASGTLLHALSDHPKAPGRLAFSPDGRVLAWTAETRVCVWALGEPPARLTQLSGGRPHLKSAAFHPGGASLATAGGDGQVRLWDAATWKQRRAYDWGVGPLLEVAFSADGLKAACGGRSGKVVVWDVDE